MAVDVDARTRLQRQTLSQGGLRFEEQLHDAARLAGLPAGWTSVPAHAHTRLIGARAEWALGWILEKWKDDSSEAAHARACVAAWHFAACLVHALPTSCTRCLQDAHFPTTIETTLEENFGADVALSPTSAHVSVAGSQAPRPHNVSESSETVHGDVQPSRKRKRGAGTDSPSKRVTPYHLTSVQLYDAVTTLVQTLHRKGSSQLVVQEKDAQTVLNTDSAQAARLLRVWLCAVQNLITSQASSALPLLTGLSLALHIWEPQVTDANDDKATPAERFSSECLVPTLLLLQTLERAQPVEMSAVGLLEQLIVAFILNPSRAAFFENSIAGTTEAQSQSIRRAELLSTSLGPLRAKLLQAVQSEDAGEPVPGHLMQLFSALPYLFRLVFRFSPSRTPKERASDRPWVQAVFMALAECAGCSLETPEYPIPGLAAIALEECLRVLSSNATTLHTDMLRDIFWFYSGLSQVPGSNETIQWPLIAALAELDPDIFLEDPRWKQLVTDAKGPPNDLARFLFGRISTLVALPTSNGEDAWQKREPVKQWPTEWKDLVSTLVVPRIIVPIMKEFARNRNLSGFLDRWADQLKSSTNGSRRVVDACIHVWHHHTLVSAIVDVLSTSFTPTNVAEILQKYGREVETQPINTRGLDIIVHTILQSISSFENIELLDPQIRSLWDIYSTRLLSEEEPWGPGSATTWNLLNKLAAYLWPEHSGNPSPAEKQRLHLLIDQACNVVLSSQAGDAKPAAFELLLFACNCLKHSGTQGPIEQKLKKTLIAILREQPGSKELEIEIAGFCANHVPLLGLFDSDTCGTIVSGLLSGISKISHGTREAAVMTLSECVFRDDGGPNLQTIFLSALLAALSSEDEQLRSTSLSFFFNIRPAAVAREQREAVLDSLVASLQFHNKQEEAILSILAHFMVSPNATATISTKGTTIFDVAQRLHDANIQSPSAYVSLQTLVTRTLAHILPNKDQTQSKRFLDKYKSKIASSLRKSRKCFPFKLAVLRGTFLAAQKYDDLLSLKRYLSFLGACLNDGTVPISHILEALNEIPVDAFEGHSEEFQSIKTLLRAKLLPRGSFTDGVEIAGLAPFSELDASSWPLIFATIAKYQLYPSTDWLMWACSAILHKNLVPNYDVVVLGSFREVLLPLESTKKLQLIKSCLATRDHVDPTVAFRTVKVLVSVLDDVGEASKEQQPAVLPILCSLVRHASDYASFTTLVESITIVIREKPFLSTQHGIECLLEALLHLSSCDSPTLDAEHAPAIYHGLCETTRTMLVLHRARLRGRFHSVLSLLQNLLLCLFVPNSDRGSAHPPWLKSSASSFHRLTPHNAMEYSQLLGTLCSPTRSSVQRLASNPERNLNDPAKAAREYASQLVYPLLSSYTRFQLHGKLEPHVRENLLVGMRELVGLASLERGSLDAMFAGLGKNERDVWKEVWRDWERMQGRKDLGAGMRN